MVLPSTLGILTKTNGAHEHQPAPSAELQKILGVDGPYGCRTQWSFQTLSPPFCMEQHSAKICFIKM